MRLPALDLSLDEIRATLDSVRRPLRVVVLRSRNPFNVGAIIRVAHSFLAREIVLVGHDRYYERAAMGMQKYEHVTELPDEAALLDRARTESWNLVVFEREVATSELWRAELPRDATLVFGSEAEGVPTEIVAAAAHVVAIPMYGINHSFPVTVAAGIAMAEWTRQHFGPRAG